VRIYIGEYEDGSTPIADTDPATARDAVASFVPGTYQALAVGPEVGHHRFSFGVRPGQVRDVPVPVQANLAAAANGATATGDGADAGQLLDGTEATDWAAERADVEGLGVTVDLAGQQRQVGRVNVSAFYESGSRFQALRQFAVLACDATSGADCTDPAAFEEVFVSPADAFPGDGMRPTSPDLNVASFVIPSTRATHLRLEVVSSQCTGGPAFSGEQDDDPATVTDCATGRPDVAAVVKAAELQAFRR
jgi:extracellular elastinolytic metalloproteinase